MLVVLAGLYDGEERAILHLEWLSSGCVVLGALASQQAGRHASEPFAVKKTPLRGPTTPRANHFSTTNSYPSRLAMAQLKTDSIGALANNIDQGTNDSRPIASGSHFVASSSLIHPKTVVDDLF